MGTLSSCRSLMPSKAWVASGKLWDRYRLVRSLCPTQIGICLRGLPQATHTKIKSARRRSRAVELVILSTLRVSKASNNQEQTKLWMLSIRSEAVNRECLPRVNSLVSKVEPMLSHKLVANQTSSVDALSCTTTLALEMDINIANRLPSSIINHCPHLPCSNWAHNLKFPYLRLVVSMEELQGLLFQRIVTKNSWLSVLSNRWRSLTAVENSIRSERIEEGTYHKAYRT